MRSEEPITLETVATLRTVRLDPNDSAVVRIIDQRRLPAICEEAEIRTSAMMAEAIRDMAVRGAGCIGVAAGFGMYLASLEVQSADPDVADGLLRAAGEMLCGTRPTAVNLAWAVGRQLHAVLGVPDGIERAAIARRVAIGIADDDIEACRRIGEHGLDLIREIHGRTARPVEILTHCNAGWLAFVEHGSATAPIYAAHQAGIPVHVIVGETRPRSQGALTAWELGRSGVPHTMVVDNAVGHLMQRGRVDIVMVGADRVTMGGDVANKIGTYLRALSARAHDIPFYVALPSSTFDPGTVNGLTEIPIEERDPIEVTHVVADLDGVLVQTRVAPRGTHAINPAFDVTPAELVTGLITERGICAPNPAAIAALFPELANEAAT